MMFADSKDVETNLISQRDRFEQFAEMPRRFDGPACFRINGNRNETVYTDFHILKSCCMLYCIYPTQLY